MLTFEPTVNGNETTYQVANVSQFLGQLNASEMTSKGWAAISTTKFSVFCFVTDEIAQFGLIQSHWQVFRTVINFTFLLRYLLICLMDKETIIFLLGSPQAVYQKESSLLELFLQLPSYLQMYSLLKKKM